jgi:hypothetical protein
MPQLFTINTTRAASGTKDARGLLTL